MPLGPPNNYSLYIRFMHLRALTDYFNKGNFGWTGKREGGGGRERERERERESKFGEHYACAYYTLHGLETSIGMNEHVATLDYYA